MKIKEWLVYLGAFSASELDGYDVEPSEGAEQGVVAQIGAMMWNQPSTVPVIVGLAVTLVVHDALAVRCKQCA